MFRQFILGLFSSCPNFVLHAGQLHPPFSTGRYNLSYQRPPPECRTFSSPTVEEAIDRLTRTISDPDLARLLENTLPNTLDTAVAWHGHSAQDAEEELTFLITGDIVASWGRDSANQLQSYVNFLTPSSSTKSLASLFRGLINFQSRSIRSFVACNAFQPPIESGLKPTHTDESMTDIVFPPIDPNKVFECKYELDTLAAFLQISTDYYGRTDDIAFFDRFHWVSAVQTIMDFVDQLRGGSYLANGTRRDLPYTFERETRVASETQMNHGFGNPVAETGLIRSFFRPSDDSCLFQFFIPANVQFAYYLNKTANITERLKHPDAAALTKRMRTMSFEITAAVKKHGIVRDAMTGLSLYAFEVDGFGSAAIMDDANIPSLLSLPLFGVDTRNIEYANTRKVVLSGRNPYYMHGKFLSGIGSPHTGFGQVWPMALVVQILTSDDDDEIRGALKAVLASTDQLGLLHESVSAHNTSIWTRPLFSWANGLFGQVILHLERERPHLLRESYQ